MKNPALCGYTLYNDGTWRKRISIPLKNNQTQTTETIVRNSNGRLLRVERSQRVTTKLNKHK